MKPSSTKVHPAAERFPLMSGADFDDLVRDIRAHGLRDPIVTYEGAILDGRNRLRACESAGVVPKTVEWDGAGLSPFDYVWSKNGARRQLPAGQKAAIRVQLLADDEQWRRREQAAEERQKAHLRNGSGDPKSSTKARSANLAERGSDEGSAARVARDSGVSKRTAERAIELAKKSPGKLAEVAKGSASMHRAMREARQRALADLVASGEAESVTEAQAKLGEDPSDAIGPADSNGARAIRVAQSRTCSCEPWPLPPSQGLPGLARAEGRVNHGLPTMPTIADDAIPLRGRDRAREYLQGLNHRRHRRHRRRAGGRA